MQILMTIFLFLTASTPTHANAMMGACFDFGIVPECAEVVLPSRTVHVCCNATTCVTYWEDPPQCRGSMCCGFAVCQ